ncbi:MAG: demethylmenaquinone methyltransferase/2-methoxy-6-polyprenyl-1,4-benzoquinol methylase [Planctomycetota bacterium]
MAKTVTPYNKKDETKKEQVEDMFDNIAHNYDFLNHLLSAGIDNTWRRKAIKHIATYNPKVVMDMASGTGDFAVDTVNKIKLDKLVALDLSDKMLDVGRQKSIKKGIKNIDWVKGDSEDLSFEDNTFDAMTVGFGVRNFGNLEKGLSEMRRVLKDGSPLVVLEVSEPDKFPMKQIFGIHFNYILPFVGKMFSKDSRAYNYLPESVKAFPRGNDFVEILKKVGFTKIEYKPLTFGICAMYTCEK